MNVHFEGGEETKNQLSIFDKEIEQSLKEK